MKYVSRFCAGIILALSLTLTAYAGHIPCPGITDEPPPPTEQATSTGNIGTGVTGDMSAGVTGEIPTGITGQISTGFVDPTTDAFLSLLNGLLSLF